MDEKVLLKHETLEKCLIATFNYRNEMSRFLTDPKLNRCTVCLRVVYREIERSNHFLSVCQLRNEHLRLSYILLPNYKRNESGIPGSQGKE